MHLRPGLLLQEPGQRVQQRSRCPLGSTEGTNTGGLTRGKHRVRHTPTPRILSRWSTTQRQRAHLLDPIMHTHESHDLQRAPKKCTKTRLISAIIFSEGILICPSPMIL